MIRIQAADAKVGQQYTTERGQIVTVVSVAGTGATAMVALRLPSGTEQKVPGHYPLLSAGVSVDDLFSGDPEVIRKAIPDLTMDQLEELVFLDNRAEVVGMVEAELQRRKGNVAPAAAAPVATHAAPSLSLLTPPPEPVQERPVFTPFPVEGTPRYSIGAVDTQTGEPGNQQDFADNPPVTTSFVVSESIPSPDPAPQPAPGPTTEVVIPEKAADRLKLMRSFTSPDQIDAAKSWPDYQAPTLDAESKSWKKRYAEIKAAEEAGDVKALEALLELEALKIRSGLQEVARAAVARLSGAVEVAKSEPEEQSDLGGCSIEEDPDSGLPLRVPAEIKVAWPSDVVLVGGPDDPAAWTTARVDEAPNAETHSVSVDTASLFREGDPLANLPAVVTLPITPEQWASLHGGPLGCSIGHAEADLKPVARAESARTAIPAEDPAADAPAAEAAPLPGAAAPAPTRPLYGLRFGADLVCPVCMARDVPPQLVAEGQVCMPLRLAAHAYDGSRDGEECEGSEQAPIMIHPMRINQNREMVPVAGRTSAAWREHLRKEYIELGFLTDDPGAVAPEPAEPEKDMAAYWKEEAESLKTVVNALQKEAEDAHILLNREGIDRVGVDGAPLNQLARLRRMVDQWGLAEKRVLELERAVTEARAAGTSAPLKPNPSDADTIAAAFSSFGAATPAMIRAGLHFNLSVSSAPR